MVIDTDHLKIDHLQMRILYLEKEIEKCQNYIENLEIKLKENPFTRDTFRDTLLSDEY